MTSMHAWGAQFCPNEAIPHYLQVQQVSSVLIQVAQCGRDVGHNLHTYTTHTAQHNKLSCHCLCVKASLICSLYTVAASSHM